MFSAFSRKMALFLGSSYVFEFACLMVLVWLTTGPIFGFSDAWQLVINTGTTIITFLMVFIIQNTQNRDTIALHLKLDEIIRALKGAHNELLKIEELNDEELADLCERYECLAKKNREKLKKGKSDIDTPKV